MRQGSAAQRIPRAILHIAAEQRLGAPESVCRPARGALLYRLLGLCVLGIGALIVAVFLLTYNSIFTWLSPWLVTLALLIAAGWLGIGTWITLTPFLYPPMRVFICPEGLICAGRKIEVIPWHEVEKLWKEVATDERGRSRRRYTLRGKDGSTMVFDGATLRNIEALGTRLEREVTQRQLPRVLTSYTQGVPLIFGDIIVSTQGIGMRRERRILPWDEVAHITIDEEQIAIYGKNGESSIVSVARVPNAGALQKLIAYGSQQHAREQLPLIASYNAGLPVHFGVLGLNLHGVDLDNGQSLPWSEVVSIGVGEDEVIIHRKSAADEWYALPLWMVSDPAALKELVQYIMLRHASS